ncbi:helix-turn-helix transcriptional regulator [uncultured Microscilla sp.]|uniref:helix-turn-helix domain-containing protein n=1 Tax=uncultured Microscilla sp. TaxID=432653 RepID=UPI002625FA2D|nr:helix-turn-helix transcriptional regulator [uncultured Microscilla sp.]
MNKEGSGNGTGKQKKTPNMTGALNFLGERYHELLSAVKASMKEKKITYDDIAEKLGIPKSTLSGMMNGTKPNAVNLLAVSVLLEVDFNRILYPDKTFDSTLTPPDMAEAMRDMVNELSAMKDQLNNNTQALKHLYAQQNELRTSDEPSAIYNLKPKNDAKDDTKGE